MRNFCDLKLWHRPNSFALILTEQSECGVKRTRVNDVLFLAVRWDTTARTYNPITGKLLKKAEPRFELIAEEAARMQELASQKATSPRFERVAEEQMKMHEISLPPSRTSSEPMFESTATEAIKVDELTRPDSLYSSLKGDFFLAPC